MTRYFKDLIQIYTKEEIENYYNKENHTVKECAIHFNIGAQMFFRLTNYFGIHKDISKHSELIKNTKQQRYGNPNYNNREQSKITCTNKYGVENPFKDTNKIKESYINKFGVEHPMKVKEICEKSCAKRDYNQIWERAQNTYKQKTGYSNPSYNPECREKGIQTKINNGVYDSPHHSKLEDKLELVLSKIYSKVEKSYRDKRYGRKSGYLFECDFYIPKDDIFIELNAHPTHGLHPYNASSKEDIQMMKLLQESNKAWDKQKLETWVYRDTEKLNIAMQNKLNYIMIYPKASLTENIQFNNKKYSNLITKIIKSLE